MPDKFVYVPNDVICEEHNASARRVPYDVPGVIVYECPGLLEPLGFAGGHKFVGYKLQLKNF